MRKSLEASPGTSSAAVVTCLWWCLGFYEAGSRKSLDDSNSLVSLGRHQNKKRFSRRVWTKGSANLLLSTAWTVLELLLLVSLLFNKPQTRFWARVLESITIDCHKHKHCFCSFLVVQSLVYDIDGFLQERRLKCLVKGIDCPPNLQMTSFSNPQAGKADWLA